MSDAGGVLLRTELAGIPLRGRGKVRDIYEVEAAGSSALLIVTTDRISAFDVVLPQGIPHKGAVLTALSEFWFERTGDICRNHLITTDVDAMPDVLAPHRDTLRGRSMLVEKCDPFPVECVARGFLAGSGLVDYRATGAVCGIELPEGLVVSSRLEEPIFTPATKATEGHDENIDLATMATIIGDETAGRLRSLTLELYGAGRDYAASRGVLLADTKFEFGLKDGEIVLIDEVLTPDSSRYWDSDTWQPGVVQPSFDKQPVRDWLEHSGWDKKPPPPDLPDEIVSRTSERYRTIYSRLTDKELS